MSHPYGEQHQHLLSQIRDDVGRVSSDKLRSLWQASLRQGGREGLETLRQIVGWLPTMWWGAPCPDILSALLDDIPDGMLPALLPSVEESLPQYGGDRMALFLFVLAKRTEAPLPDRSAGYLQQVTDLLADGQLANRDAGSMFQIVEICRDRFPRFFPRFLDALCLHLDRSRHVYLVAGCIRRVAEAVTALPVSQARSLLERLAPTAERLEEADIYKVQEFSSYRIQALSDIAAAWRHFDKSRAIQLLEGLGWEVQQRAPQNRDGLHALARGWRHLDPERSSDFYARTLRAKEAGYHTAIREENRLREMMGELPVLPTELQARIGAQMIDVVEAGFRYGIGLYRDVVGFERGVREAQAIQQEARAVERGAEFPGPRFRDPQPAALLRAMASEKIPLARRYTRLVRLARRLLEDGETAGACQALERALYYLGDSPNHRLRQDGLLRVRALMGSVPERYHAGLLHRVYRAARYLPAPSGGRRIFQEFLPFLLRISPARTLALLRRNPRPEQMRDGLLALLPRLAGADKERGRKLLLTAERLSEPVADIRLRAARAASWSRYDAPRGAAFFRDTLARMEQCEHLSEGSGAYDLWECLPYLVQMPPREAAPLLMRALGVAAQFNDRGKYLPYRSHSLKCLAQAIERHPSPAYVPVLKRAVDVAKQLGPSKQGDVLAALAPSLRACGDPPPASVTEYTGIAERPAETPIA